MFLRYFIDTNIFGKLIKDKNYFEIFSLETKRYNDFPNLFSIYFTPFSILEYLGIKVKNPNIKYSSNLKKETIDAEIIRIVNESYLYYMSQVEIRREYILQVAESAASFVDEKNFYFGSFCDYIVNHTTLKKDLALHLTANYIYNFRFPSNLRRFISAQLSYDLFRNNMLPYSVSKFRLIESDWDTQWSRFNNESEGRLSPYDKALRLKANGDNVDCDIIHHAVMGFEDNRKTYPVYIFTADSPGIVIPRISVYKGLVRFVDYWIHKTNASDAKYFIKNSEGIIVFIDQKGKVIGKKNVTEIPTFGKAP
ncbi:hypothetical protein FH587_03040 (plasmid) [Leptospira interrogans]|uniref:hypothetical protein n=1 Tax=Leptospira interrogans TaxID=173 RepID=UPI001F084E9B|nr:hypothetical protein [Leptospira interrogans]UML82899.1 hypothetical protein FH587_03040 [Leptospira interrogans]